MAPPNHFVDVKLAAGLWQLGRGLNRYPTKSTQSKYRPAARVFPSLDDSFACFPALVFVGLPKTGKTFHSLLYGFHWESTVASWQRRSGHDRRAYYAKACDLDLESAIGNFQLASHFGPTLFIVDDFQERLDLCKQLLDKADEFDFEESSHRLLFVGRSKPEELRDLPSIRIALSTDLVRLVITTTDCEVPADDVLAKLASTKALGLDEVLWAAHFDPRLLERPNELQSTWLAKWLEDITDRQVEIALDLARLNFLGLTHPITRQRAEDMMHLAEAGLLTNTGRAWSLVDELVSPLLRHNAARLGTEDLAKLFFHPIRDFLSNNVELAWPLISAMKAQSENDLRELSGLPQRSAEEDHLLLSQFVMSEGATIHDTVLHSREVTLTDLVRILGACSRYISIEQWAKELISRREAEVLTLARDRRPESWVTAANLSKFAGEKTLRQELTISARTADFGAAVQGLPADRQGEMLARVRQFDDGLYLELERSLLPGRGTGQSFWKAVGRLRRAGGRFSVKAIDSNQLGRASMAYPERCAAFIERLKPPEKEYCRHIIQAAIVAGFELGEIATWPRSTALEAFVRLCVWTELEEYLETDELKSAGAAVIEFGTPAQIINLCHSICESHKTPTELRSILVQALKKRLESGDGFDNSYVYGLILLNRYEAAGFLERGLRVLLAELAKHQGNGESPATLDPGSTFWLIFNSLTALDYADRETVREAAEAVARTWIPSQPPTGIEIALAGLIAYVSRGTRVPVVLEDTPSAEEIYLRATSASYTACQLYGIVGHLSEPGGISWFRGLTLALSDPSTEFRRVWSRLLPRSHRQLMQMIVRAVREIDDRSLFKRTTPDFALRMGSRRYDDIWEVSIVERLRIVWLSGGVRPALALLRRRYLAWKAAISIGELRGYVVGYLLFEVASISHGSPNYRWMSKDLARTALEAGRGVELDPGVLGAIRLAMGERLFQGAVKAGSSREPGALLRVLGGMVRGQAPVEEDLADIERVYSKEECTYLHVRIRRYRYAFRSSASRKF